MNMVAVVELSLFTKQCTWSSSSQWFSWWW